MSALPTNLKRKRKQLGWTQEQAAKKISEASGEKILRDTYNKIENHNVKPSIDILPAIVEVFQIDDLYLFLTKCEES